MPKIHEHTIVRIGMAAHTCKPYTQEVREHSKFKASQSYRARAQKSLA